MLSSAVEKVSTQSPTGRWARRARLQGEAVRRQAGVGADLHRRAAQRAEAHRVPAAGAAAVPVPGGDGGVERGPRAALGGVRRGGGASGNPRGARRAELPTRSASRRGEFACFLLCCPSQFSQFDTGGFKSS